MNTKNMKFFIYFPLLLGLIFSILSFRFTSPDEFTGAPLWSPVYFFSYSFFYYSFLNLLLAAPFALISLVNKKVGKFCAYIVLSVFLIFFVTDSFVYQQIQVAFKYCNAANDFTWRGASGQFLWFHDSSDLSVNGSLLHCCPRLFLVG